MSNKNEFTQTTLLQASPVSPMGNAELSNRNIPSPSPTPSLNPPATTKEGIVEYTPDAGPGPSAPTNNNLYDKTKNGGSVGVVAAAVGPKVATIPFWSENPNILLNRDFIFEFFPTEDMTYSQKLNAISRTILVLTIMSFLFTRSFRILFIGIITLAAIYFLHRNHVSEKDKKASKTADREGYEDRAATVLNGFPPDVKKVFAPPTAENPFENVLLPDYDYNPQKKPAPPSYNENVGDEIIKQAKQLVLNANPGQPDLADKLFNDLGNQFVFEQSLQPFFSNPSTTIPNDQNAFAEFCYGSMVSCKEGNLFACARNLPNQALI